MKTVDIVKIIFIATGMIFLVVLLELLFITSMMKVSDAGIITNPKDYKVALESIHYQKNITHFPRSIPENTTKVNLYSHSLGISDEILLLQLEIEKSYIEKELKKYKFINADTPVGTKQKLYNSFGYDSYTFYVLKNESNEYCYEEYFPYFNGIAVDKGLNNILYYYILPD